MPRLRYEQKLKLACALGLPGELFSPLKSLGDIRNRFGHSLDAVLTEKSVSDFFNTFTVGQKLELEEIFKGQRKIIGDHVPPFDGVHFRDLFPLSLSYLYTLLMEGTGYEPSSQ